jgi:hypothetical protein
VKAVAAQLLDVGVGAELAAPVGVDHGAGCGPAQCDGVGPGVDGPAVRSSGRSSSSSRSGSSRRS